jgi:hypothetical protein
VTQQAKLKNGKIGEVLVELELLKRDWHVERLDGSAKAVNGDLIAIRGRRSLVIQVKSALSWKRPSFGHAGPFLKQKKRFFNKENPTVLADALVTVCGSAANPIFHVFSIKNAEKIAQAGAKKWFRTKTRGGAQRSENFPVSFHLDDPAMKGARDNWSRIEAIARKRSRG